MVKDTFEKELQKIKDVVDENNAHHRWWQPKWKLVENFLFFTVCYNGFPNPFHIHKTMYGLSWSAFPKEYHALLKPDNEELILY